MTSVPIGPGVFVAVAGPSGAGKDAVIAYVRGRLAGTSGVAFARRVVTRPADPAAEDHDTLDEPAFLAAEAAGMFALTWRSHGLCYGLPVAIDDTIRAGGAVVANVSRGVLDEARRRYAHVVPVLITVAPDVLAARLAARGRETAGEIARRLSHNAAYDRFDGDCRIVDNSGELEEAGELLVRILEDARALRN